jgi:hypothetical protein
MVLVPCAYLNPHSPDNALSFGAACAIQSGKNGRHAFAGLFRSRYLVALPDTRM